MRWLEGVKVKISISVWRILRGSILMYFAPLVGAVKGISAEYERLELDRQRKYRGAGSSPPKSVRKARSVR